jgi:hypothetical protein
MTCQDTDVNDCAKLFDEDLSSTTVRVAPTTIIVTQVFAPTTTDASDSRANRPTRTPPPSIPISSTNNETSSSAEGLSTGSKIGIGVGSFLGVAAIAGAAIFFLLRRRRNAKYNQIGTGKTGQQFPSPAVTAYPSPVPTYPGHAAPGAGAFEPMRRAEHPAEYYPQDYKQQYMVSPPPSVIAPSYHDDTPALQQQELELSEMPAHQMEAHELPEHTGRQS